MKVLSCYHLKISFFLVIVLSMCASCTHYYYGPNSANVPLLQKQGDARILGAASSADETSGFELQSAYALAPHFGAMLNFYATGGKDETTFNGTTQTEKGNATYAELGAGYFTSADKANNWIFETYIGAGTGSITNQYLQSEKSKVGVTRLFLQPSIGYSNTRGTFQAAIASRFSSVKLKVKESSVTNANNSFDLMQVQKVKNNPTQVFWEPSVVVRFGSPSAKLQLQITPATALSKTNIAFQSSVLSLGAFFSLSGSPAK